MTRTVKQIENRLQENKKIQRGKVTQKLSPEEQKELGKLPPVVDELLNLRAGEKDNPIESVNDSIAQSPAATNKKKPAVKEKLVGVMVYFNPDVYEKFEELLHNGKMHSVKQVGLKLQQSELLTLITGNYYDLFIQDKNQFLAEVNNIVTQRKEDTLR
jgi:hypothetical protein